MTSVGVQESYGMIMDHPELKNVIGDICKLGSVIIGVFVSMYDGSGNEVAARDITSMFTHGN